MAIYHLNARGVAPARGSSAVAAAAYISGEALRDEATGALKRYRRRERVAETGMALPDGAPDWGRQRLWNEATRAWGGGNELVAKRWEFALPRELDADERRGAVLDFCGLFPDRACDWAIHDSGDGNPHAHVLVSALALGPDGLERPKAQKSTKAYLCHDAGGSLVTVMAADWPAAKAAGVEKLYNFKDGERRTMSEAKAAGLGTADRKTKTPVAVTRLMDGAPAFDAEKAELVRVRAAWAGIANRRLAEAAERTGAPAKEIDHRTLVDQGIARIPTVHEGSRPEPERVAENQEIRKTNGVIDRLVAELAALRERAAAWWARKTDAVTRRRQAYVRRHTAAMRATAARSRAEAERLAAAPRLASDAYHAIARYVMDYGAEDTLDALVSTGVLDPGGTGRAEAARRLGHLALDRLPLRDECGRPCGLAGVGRRRLDAVGEYLAALYPDPSWWQAHAQGSPAPDEPVQEPERPEEQAPAAHTRHIHR